MDSHAPTLTSSKSVCFELLPGREMNFVPSALFWSVFFFCWEEVEECRPALRSFLPLEGGKRNVNFGPSVVFVAGGGGWQSPAFEELLPQELHSPDVSLPPLEVVHLQQLYNRNQHVEFHLLLCWLRGVLLFFFWLKFLMFCFLFFF